MIYGYNYLSYFNLLNEKGDLGNTNL